MMKTEYNSVRNILINTISILCKNSLTYHQGLRIHGLLGITVDEEVFLVEISEQFSRKNENADTSNSPSKLPTDETCTVKASCDPAAKLGQKRNRQRKQAPSYAVEEVSEKSTILSVESCSDSNFCSKSETSANNDVFCVKKERTVDDDGDDDDDIKFLGEDVKVLPHETGLLHLQLTSDDLGFSEATGLADSSFKIKAGNGRAEVSVDNANQSSAGVEWNQTAFVNQNWLESTQSCSRGLSPSQAKLRAKKSNLLKFSTSSESRPLLSDSFSGHRWPQLRRSSVSIQKQFSCDIEGCTRSYYAKKNLLRHQTTMHGRIPVYRRHPRVLPFFYQGT